MRGDIWWGICDTWRMTSPARRRWSIAAAAVAFAGLIGAVAYVAHDSSQPNTATPDPAATIVVTGQLELRGVDGIEYVDGLANRRDGASCFGGGGYDDISVDTQVTVSVDGKTVGLGRLGPGLARGYTCVFDFTVPDVPAGLGFYTVEVSHRGGLTYTEDDLGAVKVSLG